VREEIHHIREGKHGARSPQQAIAIGLSKARRAGVKLGPPKGSASVREKAAQDERAGKHSRQRVSRARSRATERALQHESRHSVSKSSLSRQARTAAAKRGQNSRRQAAAKAVRTTKARRA
jgi:hypothetical protein